MVVANLVGRASVGFESDFNEVTLITRSADPMHIGPAPKREIANGILDQIPALRLATHSAV
jgi:phosphopantothenoylcysteine synthetase/decarboxylase